MTPGCSSPDQGEADMFLADIEAVREGENIGFAKMLESMSALAKNVGELTRSVEATQQENRMARWIFAIALTVIAIMTALK